jgi:hypothetical protein
MQRVGWTIGYRCQAAVIQVSGLAGQGRIETLENGRACSPILNQWSASLGLVVYPYVEIDEMASWA